MGFEKLETVVEIGLEFTTLGSLAIGAGDQPQEVTESPVIRIGGEPAIPGSSLKGALRSNLEALLAARGELVCVPLAAIPWEHRRGRDAQQAYVKSLGRKLPCGVNDPCPVCQIFGTTAGTQGLSGSAIFLDATLAELFSPEMLTERTHVAITRDTRSQSGRTLMTLETVESGVKFRGGIRLINPQNWQVGAVLQAIEWLKQLGLGGKKTAGYGQLNIAVTDIAEKQLEGGRWQETPKEAEAYTRAFVEKFEGQR